MFCISKRMSFLAIAACVMSLSPVQADKVENLTGGIFDQYIQEKKHVLVNFHAPWCGHCKMLSPEFEKVAVELKNKSAVAQVDVTSEKDLASKYNVRSYPTLLWFEHGKELQYNGVKSVHAIVDWVDELIRPILHVSAVPTAAEHKPNVVLHASKLSEAFETAAHLHRQQADWYFVKDESSTKVVVHHPEQDPINLVDGLDDAARISKFVLENELPLFGQLDGSNFDKYIQSGKGLIWNLLPNADVPKLDVQYRNSLLRVAAQFRARYNVAYIDIEKYEEVVESMLGVSDYPAIVVQKTAGSKQRYLYKGAMTQGSIQEFIEQVESGLAQPMLKSEAAPEHNTDAVKVVVGSTLRSAVFQTDKDVMLEVYAPWCGHCKRLEFEFRRLAAKIAREDLTDLVSIAKIDGTKNDSPVQEIAWSTFPTILYIKAGSSQPLMYNGERSSKALWKYIKQHSSQAEEIKKRLARPKDQKKADEL